jgi:hypothetical protein
MISKEARSVSVTESTLISYSTSPNKRKLALPGLDVSLGPGAASGSRASGGSGRLGHAAIITGYCHGVLPDCGRNLVIGNFLPDFPIPAFPNEVDRELHAAGAFAFGSVAATGAVIDP